MTMFAIHSSRFQQSTTFSDSAKEKVHDCVKRRKLDIDVDAELKIGGMRLMSRGGIIGKVHGGVHGVYVCVCV
jgi:hypothetical protein